MSDQSPIRILHLSDFHFSESRKWDADPVLKSLGASIRDLVADGLNPDIVAITGDVADKGKQEEYELARRWIEEELLPPLSRSARRRLLIVPGNHDVDRTKVKSIARAAQASLLRQSDQDVIASILSDQSERDVLLTRHAAYLEFANSFKTSPSALPIQVP